MRKSSKVVLCVAEKPSVAKSITELLARGQARKVSKFLSKRAVEQCHGGLLTNESRLTEMLCCSFSNIQSTTPSLNLNTT